MNPPLIFQGCKYDPRLSNCPYDIGGSAKEPGDDVFSDPKWGAIPQNPQKHRVAPCVWCNFLAVMFVSLETEVTKFLQTFRNHETNHVSSIGTSPFVVSPGTSPFFLLKIRWNRLGSGAFFPRWKRPKPRGDWATNLPWKMLEDFQGKWWWGFSVRICYCERIECLNFRGVSIYDVNPKFSLGSGPAKWGKKCY